MNFGKSAFRADVGLITDRASWSFNDDARFLRKVFHKLGCSTQVDPFFWPQHVYFVSRYAALGSWLRSVKWRTALGVDFFHGHPSVSEGFGDLHDRLFRCQHRIGLIRVTSHKMRDLLLADGFYEPKIKVCPIPVDESLFRILNAEYRAVIRKSLGIPTHSLVIGSFQKDGNGWGEGDDPKLIKGPDLFLNTLEELKKNDISVYVVLTGPARGFVKNGLKKLGVPFVHRASVSKGTMAALYNCLDLYLCCSRDEGGPKGVGEALFCGVPVVCSAVGQVPDMLKAGVRGLRVCQTEAPPKVFMEAIFSVLHEQNRASVECYQKQVRASVLASYSESFVTSLMAELIQENI